MITVSVTAIVLNEFEVTRGAFIRYGKTGGTRSRLFHGFMSQVLQCLEDLKVKKSLFYQFYLVSVLSSMILFYFGKFEINTELKLAVLCQGVRRFIESVWLEHKSTSQMWIGHYIFGITFYVLLNLSIYIGDSQTGPETSISITRLCAMALFIYCSIEQSYVHICLSRLKKYTPVPFSLVDCPHYLAEIGIYLSYTILASGKMLQYVLVCFLVWVLTSLSISASNTRNWGRQKFGKQKWDKGERFIIIPYVY